MSVNKKVYIDFSTFLRAPCEFANNIQDSGSLGAPEFGVFMIFHENENFRLPAALQNSTPSFADRQIACVRYLKNTLDLKIFYGRVFVL